LATQNTVESFEKQFAVAQADAKEVAEKLRSATAMAKDGMRGCERTMMNMHRHHTHHMSHMKM